MTITLGKCRWCGQPLEQALKGRNREFCPATDCRRLWKEEEKRDD